MRIERRGFLLVLSSPSGAGKTTITRRLVERDPGIAMSVSVTTRPRREEEVEGRDYFFVDRRRFDEMIKQGELLEHATVFGNCYGTPRAPIEEALASGRDVVGDVDWQGTQQLADSVRRDLISVFILPPSIAALEERLRARAQDSACVLAARLAKSAEEMSHWPEYDYVIVNIDIEEAVSQVRAIVSAERQRRTRQVGLAGLVADINAVRAERPVNTATITPDTDEVVREIPSSRRASMRRRRGAGPAMGTVAAPIMISPTVYPTGPAGTVLVANSIVINTNSSDFWKFSDDMAELLEQIRGSNETSPEVRNQLSGELRAGMEIVRTPQPARSALEVYLVRPLRFIGKEFTSGAIRSLAAAALSVLAKWLGLLLK